MNNTPPFFPGLVLLYRHDLIIRRTANVAGFGVLVAVGMYWVSQPVSSLPTPIDNSFDVAMMKVASLGGIVMSGLALLILLWRWMRLRRILTEGIVIKGLVEDIDVVATRWRNSNSHSLKQQSRHSYFAILRYTAQGEERKVRLKMPSSGFVYGLAKGQETDLMIHDSMPDKPLICSIYLRRS
jgi:hypothetical protein